jgi:hypothetical protein
MRGPEGKIQDAVVKYAKEEYNLLVKKNEVGRYFVSSGWPDCMFFGQRKEQVVRFREWILRTIIFFIEFKAPGGKLTPLQEHMREEIQSRGYRYYVIDDITKGRATIDKECS